MKQKTSLRGPKKRSLDMQIIRRRRSGKIRLFCISKSNPKYKTKQ